MKNLWDEKESESYNSDLALRVYTSNLLGRSDALVLHGGGNTSVKIQMAGEDILYVKGSGWDLVSIKEEGFAPVKMEALLKMAQQEYISDTQMVCSQKAAMIDKDAPNPSVEAILHALIPYKYVDHTHADAVVTISNSLNGEKLIAEIFEGFLIVPYVMPGFILARKIYEMTRGFDWSTCKGIILHHHGIFTFDDDAKKSYDKMIEAVNIAEEYLHAHAPLHVSKSKKNSLDVSTIVHAISALKGYELLYEIDTSGLAVTYVSRDNLHSFATRGVLTPEHIIRTKRAPLVLESIDTIDSSLKEYIKEYENYFHRFAKDEVCLNPAPNYVIIKDVGVLYLGKNEKELQIIRDIVCHTMEAVLRADSLGGFESISLKESFEMEYWELEQAKLRKQA